MHGLEMWTRHAVRYSSFGLLLIALLTIVPQAVRAQLLNDMLATPQTPLSRHAIVNIVPMDQQTADWVFALKEQAIVDAFWMAQIPNRKEWPMLFKMAMAATSKDVDAQRQLLVLNTAYAKLDEAVASAPKEDREYFDEMMNARMYIGMSAQAARRGDAGQRQALTMIGRRLHNSVGAEALSVRGAWLDLYLSEGRKVGKVSGATETLVIIGSATIDEARFNLDRNQRRAAINDPALTGAAAAAFGAAVVNNAIQHPDTSQKQSCNFNPQTGLGSCN